jgi:hypothetical protein|tara:strand:- start:307 stop:834 length:528 start_codon:yes stop_codon:yes gene_type:complete
MKINQLKSIVDNENDSLKESREYLIDNAKKGVECPCCTQKVKLYKRTLSPIMCLALVEIYKFYKFHPNADLEEYYTKDDFFFNLEETWMYADFQKLMYFDCIEPMFTSKTDLVKKRGYFRITKHGIDFAQREIGLPTSCFVYNGEVEEHSTQFLTIDQILIQRGIKYDDIIKVKQ